MPDDGLLQRVEKVFTTVFAGLMPFSPTLDRRDTSQWDSLKHVELMVALEREFSIRLDGGDATEMSSGARVLAVLESKLA